MKKWGTYESWLILLLGMSVVLLVGPRGNFPLNDDWRYAFMVRSLLEEGGFALNSEIAPTILLQALWGYLFTLPGGDFSFTLLRVSTLVLAVAALWSLHALLRRQSPGQPARRGMALLAFNPVFFVLSFSFMSDVPFLALCLISLYAYFRFLSTGKMSFRWTATLVALLSVWIRQPGLFLVLAFELSWLWENRRERKKWGLSLILIALALANYLGIEWGVKPGLALQANYIKVETEYFFKIFRQPAEFLFDLGVRFLMAVFYMGFFLLPLGGSVLRRFFKTFDRSRFIFAGLLLGNLAIALGGWWWLGRVFPFGGNIFYNWGLGPLLLVDTKELGLAPPDQLPKVVMFGLGLLSQINGSCLLLLLLNYWRKKGLETENLFLGLLIMMYFGAMSVFSFFDRHLLLVLVLLIIWIYKMELIVWGGSKWRFYGAVLLFGYFSVAGTHDYLAWNRVVHQGRIAYLKRGTPSDEIDAGLASNGFYGVDVGEADYHFAFRPLEGMEVVEEYGYFSWLWWEEKEVFLLKGEIGSVPAFTEMGVNTDFSTDPHSFLNTDYY